MPTLESMASELQEELARLLPESGPHLRLHASHGFAVESLMQRMGGGAGLELRYRTAIEALASLERGECDLAGFQVPLGEFEEPIMARYAQWLHADDYLLIHLAVRNTGLFVVAGNPKNIHGIADLARGDVRFVNRQIGSSTRHLISLMLQRANVSIGDVQGYESNEFTHMAIAAHIASGMADTGVGVETAARRFGLDFIPLVRERYFFAIRRSALETPAMRELLAILRSPDYLGYVGQLAGYDTRDTGRLQTLDEAFPERRADAPGYDSTMTKVIFLADRRGGLPAVAPAPCRRRAARARPARASLARPAHLGHGSLQFPLHLLHAARGVRQQLFLHAAFSAAVLRGDRAAG